MSEDETTTLAEVPPFVEEEESTPAPTFDWLVLKRDEATIAEVRRWVEVGVIESDYSWMGPSASDVGPIHGEGDYILMHEDRFRALTVVADKYWREPEGEES